MAAVLLLGSCGQMPHNFTNDDYDKLDVASANARNAINRAESLGSRVDDLESRLDDLERRQDADEALR